MITVGRPRAALEPFCPLGSTLLSLICVLIAKNVVFRFIFSVLLVIISPVSQFRKENFINFISPLFMIKNDLVGLFLVLLSTSHDERA